MGKVWEGNISENKIKAPNNNARKMHNGINLVSHLILLIYLLVIHPTPQLRGRHAAIPRKETRREEQRREKSEEKMDRSKARYLPPQLKQIMR